MRLRPGSIAACAIFSVAACSTGAGAAPASTAAGSNSATSTSLAIYAAASLKSVLMRVKETYEASRPGTTLTISTDSSAALETKIEQGAPADVFLSADMSNPQKLVDKGLADEVAKFAGNELTVIVPLANPAGIASPSDLAKPGVKVIAAEDSVPISRYATQLVENLARATGDTNFQASYAANVVSKEDNVAAVVSKIELGEGDAAIVYLTDAKASGKVKTIDVPDNANVLATYGGVVITRSGSRAAATAFLTWLSGADGQAILSSFGFLPPS